MPTPKSVPASALTPPVVSSGVADRIALFGLGVLALGNPLGAFLHNLGLGLLILAFAAQPAAWRWVLDRRETWLAIVLALHVLLVTAWAAGQWPDTSDLQWKAAGAWLKLLLFLPVAWLLVGKPERIRLSGFLFVGGVLLSGIAALGKAAYLGLPVPGRFGGLLDKPISYAFYALVSLTVLGTHGRELLGRARRRGWPVSVATGLSLAGAATFLLWAVVASGSRGPIVALLSACVAYFVAWQRWMPAAQRFGAREAVYAAVALALLLTFAHQETRLLAARFTEAPQLSFLGAGPPLGPEANTVNMRYSMWQFAWQHIQERPLAGWGPGTLETIERSDGDPRLLIDGKPWDHLHNAYLQMLFNFGVVGSLLFAAIALSLLSGVWWACRAGSIDPHWLVGVSAGAVALAVYSITDFRHLNFDWRGFWTLTAGAVLALGASTGKDGTAGARSGSLRFRLPSRRRARREGPQERGRGPWTIIPCCRAFWGRSVTSSPSGPSSPPGSSTSPTTWARSPCRSSPGW